MSTAAELVSGVARPVFVTITLSSTSWNAAALRVSSPKRYG